MWTWPNLLTSLRLAGVPILIALTLANLAGWVLGIGILLVLTDWLDGVLARRLGQQSQVGARLDTIADVLLGLTLLFAVSFLNWGFVSGNWIAIAAMLVTYAASGVLSLLKFKRWPSYHNYLAKLGMTTGSIAGVAVLGQSINCCPNWIASALFYLASVVILLANLEAMAITRILVRYRDNVPTIWHALKHGRSGTLN